LYPSLHVHSNPSTSLVPVHIPPLRHGLGWHLFWSENTQYTRLTLSAPKSTSIRYIWKSDVDVTK
jgi:hypothetical protein